MINSRPHDLFNRDSFYPEFVKDLTRCQTEVIIESPFITSNRMNRLLPLFESLLQRKVQTYVITRDSIEYPKPLSLQTEYEIQKFERLGIQVFLWKGHHRKLAILDRKIVWEGSLNILSQSNSWEIMRRIENQNSAEEMLEFLGLKRYLNPKKE